MGPDESSPPESSFDSEELGLDDELLGSSLGDEDSDDSGDSELLGLSSLEELDEELELVPLEPSTCVQALMPRAIVPAIAATLSLRVINLVMCPSPCSE